MTAEQMRQRILTEAAYDAALKDAPISDIVDRIIAGRAQPPDDTPLPNDHELETDFDVEDDDEADAWDELGVAAQLIAKVERFLLKTQAVWSDAEYPEAASLYADVKGFLDSYETADETEGETE